MKTNWIKGLSFAAVAAVAVMVSAPAHAICGSAIGFGQDAGSLNCGGTYCYITSPGVGTQASVEATFWHFGTGNPNTGTGDDNGTYPDTSWLRGPYPGGISMSGDWAASPQINGCPDPVTPIPNQRMVAQFSDTNAAGTQAFMAIACVQRLPANRTQFDFAKVNQNIALKAIPKTVISNTVRVGNEAQITVASPDYSTLVYTDGSSNCNAAALIPQFEVWLKQVARNGAAPADRNSTATDGGAPWVLAGTCTIGAPCTVTTTCGATNCDFFASVAPKYNSGFNTSDANGGGARLSPNSNRGQAGPTLATPPDFKVVPKKPAPKTLSH